MSDTKATQQPDNHSSKSADSQSTLDKKHPATHASAGKAAQHEAETPQACGIPDDALSEVDELAQAQGELAILKAKNADLTDQLLRATAEAHNARRRAEEEVAKARKFGIESFAESLLPVLDSLEAGLALKDATLEHLREGGQATLRQLKSALERNKVMAIDPLPGDKFDPSLHQAISVVPSEQEPNTVVAVLQKGYHIAERVMRPALVTVAAS